MPSPLSLTGSSQALAAPTPPGAHQTPPYGGPTTPIAPVPIPPEILQQGNAPVIPTGVPSASSASGPRPCPACGFEVPTGFMFCGACGNRLGPQTASMKPMPSPEPVRVPNARGRLTMIRPDGSEGGTIDLWEGENKLGRAHGPVFESDGYVSPTHAMLRIGDSGVVIRDEDSLNGVFVRIVSEEMLRPGDVFRVGQELLRFDVIATQSPLPDGTEVMGSPNPGYWGRLSVIIGKDIDGSAYPIRGESITLGRERGDVNFPEDGYVSGLHARLSTRGGLFYVTDLGSSNGTFVRIRSERTLANGSFVLLGQQLFRLNLE